MGTERFEDLRDYIKEHLRLCRWIARENSRTRRSMKAPRSPKNFENIRALYRDTPTVSVRIPAGLLEAVEEFLKTDMAKHMGFDHKNDFVIAGVREFLLKHREEVERTQPRLVDRFLAKVVAEKKTGRWKR